MATVREAVEVTKLAARQRVDGVRRGGATGDVTLSSRAHLIVMVFVLGQEKDPRASLAEGTLTRLLLVDLAGCRLEMFSSSFELPAIRRTFTLCTIL